MEVVSNQRDHAATPAHGQTTYGGPPAPAPGSKVTRAVMLVLIVVVVAVVVLWGISSRRQANAQLSQETHDLAIPTVSVVHPKIGAPQQEIVIPGDMQPYADAPIFARTNGYLKKWYADIGANVKSGQLLAEIDSPEVDQQLQAARADLSTAEANLNLAQVTAARYKDLVKTDSVAQQDVDNANGSFEARRTTVQSAQANVKRLQDMQAFEKVFAPFDGVITARNTDVGQLIDSGSSGGTLRELFHIAAVNPLRVYINVPQLDSPEIRPGLHADLVLTEFPGRRFQGTVVRSSGAIDNSTRTLLTEVDVDNSARLLKPGGYVEVHLKLPSPVNTFTLPVNATIFKSAGLQVAIVKDGKTVSLVPVTPGRDFGTVIEIVAGLKGDEWVVLNPSDSLTEGAVVRVAETPAAAQGETLMGRLIEKSRAILNGNGIRQRKFLVLFLEISLLGGCSVGPKYSKPTTQIPPAYKENANWKTAQPSDQAQKGNWWEIFQDAQLNALEEKLSVSNQTLRAAADRFQEARDVLRETRSAFYPLVTASVAPSQNRQSQHKALFGGTAPVNYSDLTLAGDVSYEVDAWGAVRHSVESSRTLAQASAADLETIRLSLHAELALDYLTLRGLDAQKQLFDTNVEAFDKALQLTESRFQGGVASREDVDLAATQLEQTRAEDIDITSARDQFEHAVAVLVGQPASSFSLDPAPLPAIPPVPPPGLPSDLLERRPDIAEAERRVASANEQIGIARAAFFPTITLGLVGGFESGRFPNWLTGPSALWSIGASAAETVFDAGRRRAVSDQTIATYDELVADYQQTVLTSFQEVEDSLSDLRVLDEEAKTQDAAVAAANRALEQSTNRYKGGLDTYLTVITAQSAALANERTAVSLLTRRLTSTVLLVKALGGGWDVSKLPAVD